MVERELTELLEKQRLDNEKKEQRKNAKHKSRADSGDTTKQQRKVKR